MEERMEQAERVTETLPAVTESAIAFGGIPRDWFNDQLKKPRSKKWEDVASGLFFNGGKIPVSDKLDKNRSTSLLRLFRCIIGSFEPSHEDKEHVCGRILAMLNGEDV
jgi:hypothetical protein